jgi:hypothetical protein
MFVSKGDADSSSGGGWFNMLLTDTLPCCRDPFSQQVRADCYICNNAKVYTCTIICSCHRCALFGLKRELACCSWWLVNGACNSTQPKLQR